MAGVKDSVRAYLTENPCADYKSIVTRFGTPQQIVETFVEEMEPEQLLRNLHFGRKVVDLVAITLMVVILLWAGVVFYALLDHVGDMNGYIVEEIINVVDIPNETGG